MRSVMLMSDAFVRIPTTLDDGYQDEFVVYADEPCEHVLMDDFIEVYLPDGDRCNPQLVRIEGTIDMVMYDNQGILAGMVIFDRRNESHTVPCTQEIFHVRGERYGR